MEEVSVVIDNFTGSTAFVFPIYTNSVLNGAVKSEKISASLVSFGGVILDMIIVMPA